MGPEHVPEGTRAGPCLRRPAVRSGFEQGCVGIFAPQDTRVRDLVRGFSQVRRVVAPAYSPSEGTLEIRVLDNGRASA